MQQTKVEYSFRLVEKSTFCKTVIYITVLWFEYLMLDRNLAYSSQERERDKLKFILNEK